MFTSLAVSQVTRILTRSGSAMASNETKSTEALVMIGVIDKSTRAMSPARFIRDQIRAIERWAMVRALSWTEVGEMGAVFP